MFKDALYPLAESFKQPKNTFGATVFALTAALILAPLTPVAHSQQNATRQSAETEPMRIAAAADLQPVLPPLVQEYEKETGTKVDVTYESSAALSTKIENGAPYDCFLSADLSFPNRLITEGLADTAGLVPAHGEYDASKPITYAKGTLVLWTRKDSKWPTPTLATLSDPNLKRLAIANPDRAPYGRAAMAALTNLKLTDALKPKLVTAENISQAAQFAETGNADAGLISLTSASTEHLKSIGSYFVIPADLYPPIEQGAVIINASKERQNAHNFIKFLISAPIQQQLLKSGLTPVR